MPLTSNENISIPFFPNAQMVTGGIVLPKQIKNESKCTDGGLKLISSKLHFICRLPSH